MMTKVLVVFLVFVLHSSGGRKKQQFKIGGLFTDREQSEAFQLAVDLMNAKYSNSHTEITTATSTAPIHDTLEAYNQTCRILSKGIIGLFGPSSTYSSPYIQSLCDLKEIPHIETHQDLNMKRNDTLVNVHPHPKMMSNVFVDLINAFNWQKIIVIYENNESLLGITSLLEMNEEHGRKVLLRQLESENGDNDFRKMLIDVKLTGETEYIIACSHEIIEEVLKQLQQVGMMTDAYSYIITDLDMYTLDLSPFQYAGTNITGINLMTSKENEDLSFIENNFSMKMNFATALIIDAVQLFFETIFSPDESLSKYKSIKAKPIFCKMKDNWEFGYTIINSMKTKSLDGLTGLVKFDEEGFRKDFKVDILELSIEGLQKVGWWQSGTRRIYTERVYKPPKRSTKGSNIFNSTIVVLISISPPYGMLKQTTAKLEGNDRFEGFGIDVIEELARIYGFNYTFIVQDDGANGSLNKTTGKWNGMIREIMEERADLAITDLTVTSERAVAVEFTMPFMNLGISILYKKPEPVPPSLFMFASPFSIKVWIMLAVSYFVVSLAIFVMGRLSPSEWQNPYPCVEDPKYLVNQFTIRNSLWFTIGALMQQGTELAPVAISVRTASGVWWFFVLIMVSSYTANLAAFLTVETLVTPFKNVDELAAQNKIKFGAKKDGATANYFRDSNLTTYKNIWKYMYRHPELMTSDNDEGVMKVETEDYAFFMESTSIEYVTERHCNLARVGGLLDDKGYGIAMKKDSPYRNELSRAILKLQETGVLTRLQIKWWKEKRGGGNCVRKSEGGEATALDLMNVGGVFLVLFLGTILGLFGSFIELIFYIYRKAKKDKLSFEEEFIRELKFFINVKKNAKEVHFCDERGSQDSKEEGLI